MKLKDNPRNKNLKSFLSGLEKLIKKHDISMTNNELTTLFLVDNKKNEYIEIPLDVLFDEIKSEVSSRKDPNNE